MSWSGSLDHRPPDSSSERIRVVPGPPPRYSAVHVLPTTLFHPDVTLSRRPSTSARFASRNRRRAIPAYVAPERNTSPSPIPGKPRATNKAPDHPEGTSCAPVSASNPCTSTYRTRRRPRMAPARVTLNGEYRSRSVVPVSAAKPVSVTTTPAAPGTTRRPAIAPPTSATVRELKSRTTPLTSHR